jgi:hypothetical protein
MARDDNEVIVTVSLSTKNPDPAIMLKVLEAIRAMPEYRNDDASPEKDTRRGGIGIRYEPFVFHKQ